MDERDRYEFRAGQEAFREGKQAEENPFPAVDSALYSHQTWQKGYEAARAEYDDDMWYDD